MSDNIKMQIDRTVDWIKDYVMSSGSEGVVVGLSGGIDSALVAHLIKRAFPYTSLGIILPCKSSPSDKEHAILAAESAGIRHVEVNLDLPHEYIFSSAMSLFDGPTLTKGERKNERMSDANLRARLRMSTLYTLANSLNYLVAGTDNAAEILTGYFTKYGDGGVDFLPIAPLKKREVYEWCAYLGVPSEIMEKDPSAGLWEGQTDETEMGVTYDEIDDYIDGKEVSEESRHRIENLSRRSMHKKTMPPQAPRF